MKNLLKYLRIFICSFILLIVVLFVIFLFYSSNYERKQWSDSNFSEDEIDILYNSKSEIINIMRNYISNKYNLPLYLQWVTIDIENSGGKITKEFIGCRFNTFKKESNEYGHIVADIELVKEKSFSLNATFGDDKNFALLKENKQIWNNIDDLDIILEAASEIIKEENMNKTKYEYTLEINKKIVLCNYEENIKYIYDNKKGIFLKNKE